MLETMDATLNDRANRIIALAGREARAQNHDSIGTEHILLGLLCGGDGIAVISLEAQGISLDVIGDELRRQMVRGSHAPSGVTTMTWQAERVMAFSRQEVAKLHDVKVGTEHILLGLLRETDGLAGRVLRGLGVSVDRMRAQVVHFKHGGPPPETVNAVDGRRPAGPAAAPRTALLALDRHCQNLTREAAAGRLYPVIDRDQEIAELVHELHPGSGGCALLVASAADGLAVLAGLARLLGSASAPAELRGKRLYYFDPDAIEPKDQWLAALLEVLSETADGADIIAIGQLPAAMAAPSVKSGLTAGPRLVIGVTSAADHRPNPRSGGMTSWQFRPVHVAERVTVYALGKSEIALRAAARGKRVMSRG